MTRFFVSLSVLFLCVAMTARDSAAAESLSPVALALSARHGVPPSAQLVKLAGGEDQLVAELLELRNREDLPPMVGIRAQQNLIKYASRDDVQQAFLADIDGKAGLAKVLMLQIDSIPDRGLKRSLAEKGVLRARRDGRFRTAAGHLRRSSDPDIRQLAEGIE